jgi:hypothetical protein
MLTRLPGDSATSPESRAVLRFIARKRSSSDVPVRLGRPPRCPQCAEPGAAIPMTRAQGSDVDLLWLCRECRHQWPVTLEEIRKSTATRPY